MNTLITVQNLKCGGCANTITKKLQTMEDVSNVNINVEDNTVFISYSKEETYAQVVSALKTMGYPEENESNTLGNKAKSYVSCAIGKMDL
ncbi:heavy metal-associated domain-containing protein [Flavobacterium sp.]|uniref:heavy-metal-associated domain-containing protein n=1 Tax=Flavobacterium sp. TaxID=239 RepID=UPI002619FF2D|nr:heavy metal-associated domain-containing protein [Flavobacterium sp.]MDD2986479.1 heavy metal-associated domain-containing protein [Flavobacterium sp.]